jgi:nitrate reductase gamma subunit
MRYVLAAMTYFGYLFIIVMYSAKIVKYLRLPMHLRSEVYPVIPGGCASEEKPVYENVDWWTKPTSRDMFRRIWFLFSDYFLLAEYFRRDRGYWWVLYPWHIGFILIITFHILSFFGALFELLGVPVGSYVSSPLGMGIYYVSLATGAMSFIMGFLGSIGVLIRRLSVQDLRDYATPQNYFTYVFLLFVFLSGLYGWIFADPTFSEYREFWRGLITLKPVDVEPAAAVHILLFAFLLMYLPFTRSLHYITRLFGFWLIRWDDEPNVRGSFLEKRVNEALDEKQDWGAPHIKGGSTWRDAALDVGSRENRKV